MVIATGEVRENTFRDAAQRKNQNRREHGPPAAQRVAALILTPMRGRTGGRPRPAAQSQRFATDYSARMQKPYQDVSGSFRPLLRD
jgi:hypothetical protein